jgi:hypothetical protein
MVGVASVVVALVFSALQMRSSSEQIRQGQESVTLQRNAAQLQTLLEVSTRLDASRSGMDTAFLNASKASEDVQALRLIAALRPNEPIAYALNHRLVRIPGAARLWGNTLRCNLLFATQGKYGGRVPRYFPELVRYVRTAPPAIKNGSCL